MSDELAQPGKIRQLVRRADAAAERYEEAWLPRSAIQAIPVLGSVIDNIITGKIAAVQRERFERFVEDLRVTCENLDDSKIDRDFLESEEFIDLFVLSPTVTRSGQVAGVDV